MADNDRSFSDKSMFSYPGWYLGGGDQDRSVVRPQAPVWDRLSGIETSEKEICFDTDCGFSGSVQFCFPE